MAETPTQGGTGGDQLEVIWGAGGDVTPAPVAAPPRKRFPWGIALIVLVVAAAVVAGVHYYNLSRPVDIVKAAAADAEAWFECDIGVIATRGPQVEPLLEAIEKSGLEKRAASLLERSSGAAGFKVNWEEDIKPWAGPKFGFSVSGIFDAALGAQASRRPKPPAMLGVMAVRDRKRADAFFSRLGEHLRKKRQWKASTQSQHGEVIHVYRPSYSFSEGEDFCYAVTGRVLLVSNRPSEVANAIARLKGSRESLATAEWYRKTIAKAPPDAFLRGVFSTEKMKDLYRAAGLSKRESQELKQAIEGSATTFALWSDITPDGITSGSFAFPSKVQSKEVHQALAAATKENAWVSSFTTAPKDSLASLGICGLAAYYQFFAPGLATGPYSYGIKMFEGQTGLSLEKDVFGWMHGLTVTLISVGKGPAGVELVGEIRAQSPDTARGKVAKLVGTVCQLGGLVTKPVKAGTAPATALMFSGRPVLYYAFVDDSVLVASDTKSLQSSLRARNDPAARITAGAAWQKAAAARRQPAWCAVFADTPQIAQAVENTTPPAAMGEGGEQVIGLLKSILWIAASATTLEDGYGSSFSAGIDYDTFCQNLAGIMEKAEKEMPKSRRR